MKVVTIATDILRLFILALRISFLRFGSIKVLKDPEWSRISSLPVKTLINSFSCWNSGIFIRIPFSLIFFSIFFCVFAFPDLSHTHTYMSRPSKRKQPNKLIYTEHISFFTFNIITTYYSSSYNSPFPRLHKETTFVTSYDTSYWIQLRSHEASSQRQDNPIFQCSTNLLGSSVYTYMNELVNLMRG